MGFTLWVSFNNEITKDENGGISIFVKSEEKGVHSAVLMKETLHFINSAVLMKEIGIADGSLTSKRAISNTY